MTYPPLAAIPDTFLECRTIGHAWKIRFLGPITRADEDLARRARANGMGPDGARVLRCVRCKTERVDLCIIGFRRGTYAYRLVGRSYRHPDTYHLDLELTRDDLQAELFRRSMEGDL